MSFRTDCVKLAILLVLMPLLLVDPACATVVAGRPDVNIPFVRNVGQVDAGVLFYARTFGGTVFLTEQGEIVYALPDRADTRSGVCLKERFVAGRVQAVRGEESCATRISSFKGADRSRWHSDIPAYDIVSLGEVYEDIDVKLKAHGDNVEKLFCVRPGGDVGRIHLNFEGAGNLTVNKAGELVVETDLGICTFTAPIAYQGEGESRENIEVAYALRDGGYGFELGDYDRKAPLVIDPLLASTFVGGNGLDEDYEPSVAVDNDGNVFFTGETASTNFPVTAGSYDTSFSGTSDRVIAKFNSDLTELLAATFIGGNRAETGMGICFDDNNDVYIAGYTASANFPVTSGAFDRYFNGGDEDVYIAKLDHDLTTLIASTFFGGTDLDGGVFPRIDMTMCADGDLYVVGLTNSADLPTTPSAYDRTYGNIQDFFVAKFSPELSTLRACTFLGGINDEWRPSIQLDPFGNVFISGSSSIGFPTTAGAFRTEFQGGFYDMFIAKLNGDLTELLAATYLGSDGEDNLKGIRVDDEGNVYTAGKTTGTNYPVTSGAFDTSRNGDADYAVSKLSNDLSTMLASTFVGGNRFNDGEDVDLDSWGNVHVIGSTNSTNFPVTSDAYDSTYDGSSNGLSVGYVVLDAALENILYATYLGHGAEKGKCIVVDDTGAAYLSGITYTGTFPTTIGCYDRTFNGGTTDCFISRFGRVSTGAGPGEVPLGLRLRGNYPNPFNPTTNISYTVAKSGNVTLSVYDTRGRLVRNLVSDYRNAGDYTVTWDGRDGAGSLMPSGVYACRLRAGDQVDERKMNLIK